MLNKTIVSLHPPEHQRRIETWEVYWQEEDSTCGLQSLYAEFPKPHKQRKREGS